MPISLKLVVMVGLCAGVSISAQSMAAEGSVTGSCLADGLLARKLIAARMADQKLEETVKLLKLESSAANQFAEEIWASQEFEYADEVSAERRAREKCEGSLKPKAEVAKSPQEKRSDYYKSAIGLNVWIERQGEHDPSRREFYRRIEDSKYGINFHDKVTTPIVFKFTPLKYIDFGKNQYNDHRKHAYLVRMDDGSEAYVDGDIFGAFRGEESVRLFQHHIQNPIIEFLFSESPIVLRQRFLAEKEKEAEEIEKERRKRAEIARIAEIKRKAEWKRKGGVSIGMSKEQVLSSNWGKPEKVNRTTTASGTNEQWVYGSGNYLYFRNGVLVTIQN